MGKPDHRTAVNTTDEKIMVFGLESELAETLEAFTSGKEIVSVLSALIDARIELDRVHMKSIENIKSIYDKEGKITMDSINSVIDSIDSSLELEILPAFLPLTDFTPEQFATIRNGDRFNVDGRTMHIRFEKKYIPGLRSLKVIKGSDD